MTNNKHRGSAFDDFLRDEGILEVTEALALKRVLAWQILQTMESEKMTKTAMANAMKTSRSSLDRLLDPENDSVSLKTIGKAATVLGKSLRIELVESPAHA